MTEDRAAENLQTVLIKQPMPGTRWVVITLSVAAVVSWLLKGYVGWAAVTALTIPALLAVGNKFELDAGQGRYRVGLHWAHLLNHVWQQLPPIRAVLVKPVIYRESMDSRYGWLPSGSTYERFVVLLSVPNAPIGIIAARVESETQAKQIANKLASALAVPCQRV